VKGSLRDSQFGESVKGKESSCSRLRLSDRYSYSPGITFSRGSGAVLCPVVSDPDEIEELGMTPLEQATIGLHELYSSLVSAGFTEDKALRLVGFLMVDQDNEYE
jgi:hypothetical protein